MKIYFVETSNETSASTRLRVLIPAKALANRGHTVKIINKYENCDYMIFSKHFNKRRDYPIFLEAKHRGITTVYDVCDNHFNDPTESAYYRDMTKAAAIVTCNTSAMQEVIKKSIGKESFIVNDPYDITLPFQEARYIAKQDPIEILWYGHSTNLKTLNNMINQFALIEQKIIVTALSNRPAASPIVYLNVTVNHETWSIPRMIQGLKECNIIAVPTILGDPTKITKSHNRVTDGIRAGRLVLAHPLPSYEIYRNKYAWVGENLSDGLIWAEENPHEIIHRISEGQRYIEDNLSPDKIAQEWEAALNGNT